jgi:hypothetical protein
MNLTALLCLQTVQCPRVRWLISCKGLGRRRSWPNVHSITEFGRRYWVIQRNPLRQDCRCTASLALCDVKLFLLLLQLKCSLDDKGWQLPSLRSDLSSYIYIYIYVCVCVIICLMRSCEHINFPRKERDVVPPPRGGKLCFRSWQYSMRQAEVSCCCDVVIVYLLRCVCRMARCKTSRE